MKDDDLIKELRELMELDLLGWEEFYNEQRSDAADRIEELKEVDDDTYDLLTSLIAQTAKQQNRIEELEAENARFKEALEEIAEESDSGRHDGLPEPCPAHEDVVMWLRAREALKGTNDE